ncbi:LuxR C-terminal-related transcriptional regulator [Emticicia sp.]|uniref:LuxR C-terminal-related transcriptional regulator n=1 Tax=Emticicia sp. TaxID=1930953 RepID=UPI003750A36C
MDLSKEIENILRKLYETLEKFYPEDKEIDYEKYLEKSGLINLVNNQQGNLILLVDVKRFDFICVSGSVFNNTGYQIEEFGDNIPANFMKLLEYKHLSFLNVFVVWVMNILKNLPFSYKSKQHISIWGLKLFHKNGQEMRWYMNITPIEFDKTYNPTFILLTIQNITHLIKGEDYWIRGVFGDTDKKIFVYHSNEEKTVAQDIISEREKEVLDHISQGLDTKHIASLMSISTNTVDNHRRNMLARTGTRDTTALIQLCRLMGVV